MLISLLIIAIDVIIIATSHGELPKVTRWLRGPLMTVIMVLNIIFMLTSALQITKLIIALAVLALGVYDWYEDWRSLMAKPAKKQD